MPWTCVLCTSFALCSVVLCSAMLDTVWAMCICNAFYIFLVQTPAPPTHKHTHTPHPTHQATTPPTPHKKIHPGVFHQWRQGPHHLDLWHQPLRWLGRGGVCGRLGGDWHVSSTVEAVPV